MRSQILAVGLAIAQASHFGWTADPNRARGVETGSNQRPSITQVEILGGGIGLNWSGVYATYEIQELTDLASRGWRTRLATVRNDAVIPVHGTAAYFRVAGHGPAATRLGIATTNVQTGEFVMFNLQPQSGADLVFHGPPNLNGFDLHKLVLPGAEREKFDVLFDDGTGFTILTNGVPAGIGGRIEAAQGPGVSEMTYSGVLTNHAGIFTFSGVTGSGANRTLARMSTDREAGTANPGGPGGSTSAGLTVEGLVGSMQWLLCLPSFAGQQLGCTGACAAQALACAFQWPPKASYCNWVTKIVWQPGNSLPDCVGTCEHGCE